MHPLKKYKRLQLIAEISCWQKVMEARVASQEIPILGHAEMKQRGFSFVVRFVEPSQDFILLSGMSVQPCDAYGGDVGPLGAGCQHLRSPVHGSGVATLGVAAGQCVRHFIIVQNRKELAGFRQGFVIHFAQTGGTA